MTWTTPNTAEAGTAISAADYNLYVRDNLAHLYANLPTRATLWHEEATVTAGNALAVDISTGAYCNGWWWQSAAANGDTFTQTFVLAEGTYTFYALGRNHTSGGRIDWYIDDVAFTTAQDWYAGSVAPNIVKSVAGVVIAEGGRHVLKGVVNGKHASSGGYAMYLTKYWFK